MTEIGGQLLRKAKTIAIGEIEQNRARGRDLLSLLVKANMATDVLESQRLSDKDVIARASPIACVQCGVTMCVLQRCLRFLLRVTRRRGMLLDVSVV